MSGSNTTSGVSIPEGYSPPFAVVTDTDHEAWIVIATALGLALVLLFSGIRIFIRRTISPGVGFDDAFIFAGTILSIIQSSLVLGACDAGLGKSIELIQLGVEARIERMYYASNLFFVIALGMSKISVLFFLLRLTQNKQHKLVFNTAGGLVGAWTIASTFAVALQCNLTHPWFVRGEHCTGVFLRWEIICALDMISEVGLVAMAVYLVWELNTTIARKAAVVAAFSFRLPMIIFAGMRIATFSRSGWNTNPTLLQAVFIVWTQTELNYSIMSATVPTLRPFVNNLNTQFGGITTDNGMGYSFQLSKLKSSSKMKSQDQDTISQPEPMTNGQSNAYSYGIWTPSNVTNGADLSNNINGGKRETARSSKPKEGKSHEDATSVDSNDSRRMIIRKDITWEVEHEAR